jgi:hypothetical protein
VRFRRTSALVGFFYSASSVTSAVYLGFCLQALLIASAGCGGVASQPQSVQAPPAQDFSITLSTTSLSVPQGGTSTPVNISVAGQAEPLEPPLTPARRMAE